MPPKHDEEVRVRRDGLGLILNWKAVAALVALSISGTAMWINLKNDVSNLQQRMDLVSSQLDHQGQMIGQINAKLGSPIAATR